MKQFNIMAFKQFKITSLLFVKNMDIQYVYNATQCNENIVCKADEMQILYAKQSNVNIL